MQDIIDKPDVVRSALNMKAEKVLDLCLEKMPDANVRFEATIYTIIAGYYQLGKMDKATKLSTQLFDIFENDFKVYTSQKPSHRASFNREIEQAKEIMKRLTMLAEQFNQEAYYKELMKLLTAIVPMEELMPEEQKEQIKQPGL